ncbi:unnamed protein product [Moneuplotes crassus]|uniref:Uncharacterized protein n=1 Tax=Euplotes crassus TaxID=5936 RepID=A0AAD1Y9Y0_EUPCR|nr:unnamed protein product [Moneuplotes crassus]
MFEVQQNKSLIGFKGDMSSKFEQMRIGVTDLRSRVDYKLKEMNDVMNKISDLFKLPKRFAEEISKNTAEINLLTDSKLHKLENHMDIKVKDFIEENTLNHIEPKLRKTKILIEECNLEFKDFQKKLHNQECKVEQQFSDVSQKITDTNQFLELQDSDIEKIKTSIRETREKIPSQQQIQSMVDACSNKLQRNICGVSEAQNGASLYNLDLSEKFDCLSATQKECITSKDAVNYIGEVKEQLEEDIIKSAQDLESKFLEIDDRIDVIHDEIDQSPIKNYPSPIKRRGSHFFRKKKGFDGQGSNVLEEDLQNLEEKVNFKIEQTRMSMINQLEKGNQMSKDIEDIKVQLTELCPRALVDENNESLREEFEKMRHEIKISKIRSKHSGRATSTYFDDFKNFIRDNKSIFYKDNKIIRKKFNNEIIRNSGRNSSFDKDGNELFKSLSPNDSLIHNPNQSVNYSFHENNNRKPIKILGLSLR